MNFYIYSFYRKNLLKFYDLKKKTKKSKITTQRRDIKENEGGRIGLRLKNSGRIHIKNYFPNEPG